MYVAVVLHAPLSCAPELDAERKVVCSVWRCFTNAKPSALVHQRVLQKIGRYYKKHNTFLREMHLETDGSSSQFKGRKNFFGVAGQHRVCTQTRINSTTAGGEPTFPLHLYGGVTQAHFFTQSHHGSSCADSYGGKAKQHLLKKSINEGKTSWNYSSAYSNCKNVRAKPKKNAHKSLWACDGEYIWGAISNGRDKGRRTFDNVPNFPGKVTGVDGCMAMYAFRHVSRLFWSVRCSL
jgi:hypothetical protein